jgi:bifunctional ADP-heptose synthase (sugar kinase/adenylyltransferase)
MVADYDHGLITKNILKILSNSKKFLVINSQLNSTNIGYHSLQKYNFSNVIVINESELRHELRSRTENLYDLIIKYSKQTNIRYIVITQGSEGSTLYDSKYKKFINCPAFATKIVDKVGAGDTFLSILSLSLASKIDAKLSLFFSTIAASITLAFPGNEMIVKKNELLKVINHIFK